MKKGVLLSAVFLMILTVFISAQTESFLSEASEGLFRNERDAAFSVSEAGYGPSFSSLKDWYVFAGLSNWYDQDTESTSLALPFTAGLHSGGETPWSAFLYFYSSVASSSLEDGPSTVNTSPVTVGDTTYNWVSSTIAHDYDHHNAGDYTVIGEFITGNGLFNWGVWAYASYENDTISALNTWMAANDTAIYTVYHNTAGGGEAPSPAVDYTGTSISYDPETSMNLQVYVPFYMVLGDMKLSSTSGITYARQNNSESTTISYSSPAYTPLWHK